MTPACVHGKLACLATAAGRSWSRMHQAVMNACMPGAADGAHQVPAIHRDSIIRAWMDRMHRTLWIVQSAAVRDDPPG